MGNHALDHDSLPSRIKILDWGTSQANDGSSVTLDDKSLRCFEANQKKMGREQVPLDYNHVTVPGTPQYKEFGACPTIFAYGSPKVVAGEGLFLDEVTWTPTGTTKAKDYVDISPAPVLENGRVIGLHSCALTPAGAIGDLKFYSADSLGSLLKTKAFSSYEESQPNAYKGYKHMDEAHDNMEANLGYFRKKLNLGEGTTAEDIMVAIRAKWEGEEDGEFNMNDLLRKNPGASVDPSKRNMEMPKNAPTGTISFDAIKTAIDAAITPLTAKIATFEAKDAERLAAAETAERAQLVAEASRMGKVIPLSADAIKTVPLPALKEMVAQLPKSVPVKGIAVKPLNADERTAATQGSWQNAKEKLNAMFDRSMATTIPVIPSTN